MNPWIIFLLGTIALSSCLAHWIAWLLHKNQTQLIESQRVLLDVNKRLIDSLKEVIRTSDNLIEAQDNRIVSLKEELAEELAYACSRKDN